MKQVFIGSVAGLIGVISIGDPTIAQVVPDNTVGTTVNLNGTAFEINNGTRSGNNLFHSFSQFSIPTNGSAIFNNALDVQNIFSRITGSQLSNIDGILKAQGGANLFLMNPNGIVFGPNAQLQLGGSFLGTTASGIKFADGNEFNTVNTTPALLSVNLPIGLQMGTGSTPGAIVVQGSGHLMSPILFPTMPLNFNQTPVGLQVSANKTLALVGGSINLDGGLLTAPGGRVELGAVQSSPSSTIVNLYPEGDRWKLDYSAFQKFGDIQLQRKALVNISGSGIGAIQIQGRQVTLQDGSALIWENRGRQTGEGITIRSTDSLTMMGRDRRGFFSGIYSDAKSSGSTGPVSIETGQFLMQNGSLVVSRTLNSGIGGDIFIKALKTQLLTTTAVSNTIATRVGGSGKGGDVVLNTQSLLISGAGGLASTTSNASGAGGNVIINAPQFVEMNSLSDGIAAQTILSASSVGGTGNAGSLTINTGRLLLKNGAVLSSSTFGSGNGGQVMVNATDAVDLIGTRVDPINGFQRSTIRATGLLLPPFSRQLFGLPNQVKGTAGNVVITTPRLRVVDGGEVSVGHNDRGNAGNLTINAQQIQIDRQGRITANTASGEGGNITLQVQELLSLRNGSFISTSAKGIGNGGNIKINAPILLGLNNSDIIANATKGRGGNIQITTQGIFGLKYHPALTPENDITASSEFGINGNVQVNTIGINPTNNLNTLPVDIVDSSRQIADRCDEARTSSFIATGRGGMSPSPMQKRGSDRPWNDLRSFSHTQPLAAAPILEPLVEASALQIDPSGGITLIAAQPVGLPSAATCGMGDGALAESIPKTIDREHSR